MLSTFLSGIFGDVNSIVSSIGGFLGSLFGSGAAGG